MVVFGDTCAVAGIPPDKPPSGSAGAEGGVRVSVYFRAYNN